MTTGVKQGPRRSPNTLLELPPDPRRVEPIAEPPLPMRWAAATADDIQQAVEEHQLAACERSGRGQMTCSAEERLVEARDRTWLGEVAALEESLLHLRRRTDAEKQIAQKGDVFITER